MALLSTQQLEAEPRKLDLEVTARCVNEVEAVQHMHLTNIPVWFGLLRIDALEQWCLRMLLGIR